MPSTYTHYRFAQRVLEELNGDIYKMLSINKNLFLIGSHGPDILFYYKPLRMNKINSIGYGMHSQIAKPFFEKCRNNIMNHKNGDEALAYAMGFICHFILDSECHGYIDKKINLSGISHTEIEVEFERMLLINDGKNPIQDKLTNHINFEDKDVEVIRTFFPKLKFKEVKKALDSMIRYNDFLIAPGKIKRNIIYLLLKVTGNYKEMKGLLVNYEKNEQCEDSNMILNNKFDKAVKIASDQIIKYYEYVKFDGNIDDRFNRNYE